MNADDLLTFREYLVDRAAQMDGATRLEMAIRQLSEDDQQSARTFQRDMAQIRGDIMQRGAKEVQAISDDEWSKLVGED